MMDILEIREYLPQRYPFLLVDRVTNVEAGKFIHAIHSSHGRPGMQGRNNKRRRTEIVAPHHR